MKRFVDLSVPPEIHGDHNEIKRRVGAALKTDESGLSMRIVRRSIDARRRPVYRLKIEVVSEPDQMTSYPVIKERYGSVNHAEEVVIVGSGPAGYFAALKCLELGRRPIILERGKDVQARRRDLKNIQQASIVNPDSNYCFGEGGAGTYSDGKLYTRSKKKGPVQEVLQILVEHGADSDIRVDAHPHIGSNKLPKIISNIRATIEHFGGEVRFNHLVTDISISNGSIKGVTVNGKDRLNCRHLILATGHSARDIFRLLHRKQLALEAKPFALGVRIEHPQALIDEVQYNQRPRSSHLPPASYRLATEVKGRGVFSFCMCPGGLIVPAATSPGELVTNGMSLSRRDSPFANAGFVVAVAPEHLNIMKHFGELGGLEFQKRVEQNLWEEGDGSQKLPGQRLMDFLQQKVSTELPGSSYIPGLISSSLHQSLPSDIYDHLNQGLRQFGKQMKGFLTNEAVVVAPESRTSSPVRIPRDQKTLMHPQVQGLYPCGEGAGYAGGIMSAALDGQMIVNRLVTNTSNQ